MGEQRIPVRVGRTLVGDGGRCVEVLDPADSTLVVTVAEQQAASGAGPAR